jgi:hypothetical protein
MYYIYMINNEYDLIIFYSIVYIFSIPSSVPLRSCAFSDTSTAWAAEPSFSAAARTDAC